jgi:hypothetical protein
MNMSLRAMWYNSNMAARARRCKSTNAYVQVDPTLKDLSLSLYRLACRTIIHYQLARHRRATGGGGSREGAPPCRKFERDPLKHGRPAQSPGGLANKEEALAQEVEREDKEIAMTETVQKRPRERTREDHRRSARMAKIDDALHTVRDEVQALEDEAQVLEDEVQALQDEVQPLKGEFLALDKRIAALETMTSAAEAVDGDRPDVGPRPAQPSEGEP